VGSGEGMFGERFSEGPAVRLCFLSCLLIFAFAIMTGAILLRPAEAQISFTGTSAIGPFTQTQVDAGRIAYNAACAACHGINLLNGSHRTPLIGPSFMVGWGRRSTIEYMRYVRYRMPLREPGTLSLETYADITAYILAANGALPGPETMTEATAVTINTIADGVVREPVLASDAPQPVAN